MTTSTPCRLPFLGRIWSSRLAACSPCLTALRSSPIPPSSPITWTPGRLDSKNSSISGRSTPLSLEPITRRMAWTGHSAAHRPCPMQWSAWTRVATPRWMPRMSPSGHAFRQERDPMQISVSMTGCSDRGTWRFLSSFSWSTTESRACLRRRLATWPIAMTSASSTATAAMALDTMSTRESPHHSASSRRGRMIPRPGPFPAVAGRVCTYPGLLGVPRKRREGPANRGPLVILKLFSFTPASRCAGTGLPGLRRQGPLLQPDGHGSRDEPGGVGPGDDADEHGHGEVEDGADAEDEEADQGECGGERGEDGSAQGLVDRHVDDVAELLALQLALVLPDPVVDHHGVVHRVADHGEDHRHRGQVELPSAEGEVPERDDGVVQDGDDDAGREPEVEAQPHVHHDERHGVEDGLEPLVAELATHRRADVLHPQHLGLRVGEPGEQLLLHAVLDALGEDGQRPGAGGESGLL